MFFNLLRLLSQAYLLCKYTIFSLYVQIFFCDAVAFGIAAFAQASLDLP